MYTRPFLGNQPFSGCNVVGCTRTLILLPADIIFICLCSKNGKRTDGQQELNIRFKRMSECVLMCVRLGRTLICFNGKLEPCNLEGSARSLTWTVWTQSRADVNKYKSRHKHHRTSFRPGSNHLTNIFTGVTRRYLSSPFNLIMI